MALTRITKGVIKPNEDYETRNIKATGIITATELDVNGNADISGNLSVQGVLTYEDVTSIDSVGIITTKKDIHVGAGISAVGLSTFSNGVVVKTGTATTALIVEGNARVTGILTIGTGSLTITDRDINAVGVVTGSNFKTGSSNLHSTGLNVGNTFLHSTGVEAAGINVLGADTPIGLGATIYDSGAAVFTGVVTATQFKGDGSELTGVSGFSTALSNDTSSLLNQIFKTNNTHNVAAGTSVTIQSDIGSGNIAFTRLQQINVATGATVHVAAGTTFLMNVLNVF